MLNLKKTDFVKIETFGKKFVLVKIRLEIWVVTNTNTKYLGSGPNLTFCNASEFELGVGFG